MPHLCLGQYHDNSWADDPQSFFIGDKSDSRTFVDGSFGVDVTGSVDEAKDSFVVSDTWVVKLAGDAW